MRFSSFRFKAGAIYEQLCGTIKFNTLPAAGLRARATPALNCGSFKHRWRRKSCKSCYILRIRKEVDISPLSHVACDPLEPPVREVARARSHGSKKRPLIRPLLLHVPPPPFCQIATNQSSISVQCFQFSPSLRQSLARTNSPIPLFLIFPLPPSCLRLTVMSLAGRPLPSRCVVGDGMITSQKVSL